MGSNRPANSEPRLKGLDMRRPRSAARPVTRAGTGSARLSVVVPAFNEGDNLRPFVSRLAAALADEPVIWDLTVVDDGSTDHSVEVIRDLNRADRRVGGLVLSRNFGKELAIAAGLSRASGDATVILDADLQHPPELIPNLLASWKAGHEVVFAQRSNRNYQGIVRRTYSKFFYQLFSKLAGLKLPPGIGDFVLLDQKATDVLRRLGETARFNKGLYRWIGFKVALIPFSVEDRNISASKWTTKKLLSFAVDGLVSFSSVPLRISSILGCFISILSLIYTFYIITLTLVFGTDLPGFPSLIMSIMFFAGIQLISLGIIGEYVARIFDEVKGRPLFIVSEVIEQSNPDPHSPSLSNEGHPLRRRFRPIARSVRRHP